MGGLLALWGAVTVADIVLVHWVLRRHRLYRGEHVSVVEAAVAGLGAVALARGAAWLDSRPPGPLRGRRPPRAATR